MLADVKSHPQSAECIAGDTSQCYSASHFEQYSTLRMEQTDIDALTKQHLSEFDTDLHRIYPDFDTYPAAVKKSALRHDLQPWRKRHREQVSQLYGSDQGPGLAESRR